MKLVSTGLAILLAAVVLPAHADPAPTPEQQNQVENCKILSGAVFEFAEARDKKQSKLAAFKSVTHGQNYVPGSLLDETLQWAYAHPEEQPDTTSAHFYGRCVLDAYDARSPDSEGELDIAAAACQQGHAGAPDAIRDCIDSKTQDIIAHPASAVAATSSAAPAAATALASAGSPAAQAPSAATVVAVVTPPPAATMSPQPVAVVPPSLPATAPAATPTPVAATQVAASAPGVVPTPTVAQPSPEPTPALTPAAPVVPAAQPMVAAVQAPSAPPQAVTLPSAPMPKTEVTLAAPAATVAEPVIAAAAGPLVPPQAVVPPPVPVVAKPAPAPAPVVAKAVATQPAAEATSQPAVTVAPLPASRPVAPGEFPPNLPGYGKLTVGMSMDDAYKALGSHGDTDWDAQGEVHTYMIGDDHGFMELRASSSGTLYSIRVVGGADAQQPPVMSVVLGDAAFILINAVGLPSSRTPLPGDKELWNYRDRNYAWEISPGGDVIGLRIIDTSSEQAAPASAAPP